MADRFDDKDDDEPLDPAVERIQQRLRRLILVSGGTLAIGVLAVLFAVVWRVMHLQPSKGAAWTATIELPAGATVVSSDVDGDRVAVTLDGTDGRAIQVYELSTGRMLGRTVLIAR